MRAKLDIRLASALRRGRRQGLVSQPPVGEGRMLHMLPKHMPQNMAYKCSHSHERALLALLDVELPPLIAQKYSKCKRKSVRVQLDRAHEAKDQVGCKDCSKLRDACSREMAKARPRTRKPTQNNKPSAHKRGHLLAKCMENLCKTVENFKHMVHSVGSRQTHASSHRLAMAPTTQPVRRNWLFRCRELHPS